MEFKDRIKSLREEKGLNLTQLAVEFDLKEAGVRSWENGRTKPGADTLIKLAEYFGCSTDYLLGVSAFKNEKEHDTFLSSMKELETLCLQVELGTEIIEYITYVLRNRGQFPPDTLKLYMGILHNLCLAMVFSINYLNEIHSDSFTEDFAENFVTNAGDIQDLISVASDYVKLYGKCLHTEVLSGIMKYPNITEKEILLVSSLWSMIMKNLELDYPSVSHKLDQVETYLRSNQEAEGKLSKKDGESGGEA